MCPLLDSLLHLGPGQGCLKSLSSLFGQLAARPRFWLQWIKWYFSGKISDTKVDKIQCTFQHLSSDSTVSRPWHFWGTGFLKAFTSWVRNRTWVTSRAMRALYLPVCPCLRQVSQQLPRETQLSPSSARHHSLGKEGPMPRMLSTHRGVLRVPGTCAPR